MDRKDIFIFIAITLAVVSISLQLNRGPQAQLDSNTIQPERPLSFDSSAASVHAKRALEVLTVDEQFDILKRRNDGLTRTLIKLQASIESQTRLEGNSGVTHVRSYSSGTQPYYQPVHSTDAVLGIVRTCSLLRGLYSFRALSPSPSFLFFLH